MVVNSNTERKQIVTSRDRKQCRSTLVPVIRIIRVDEVGVSVVVN